MESTYKFDKDKNMRKNLSSLPLLILIVVVVTACVRATAAPPPATPTGDSPTQEQPTATGFTLTSPGLLNPQGARGYRLPAEYTCDGSRSTLELEWSGAPAGTQSYAIIMHHIPGPNEVKWYWIVYNVPSSITSLPKNMTGIGTLGTNSVNDRQEYAPPCSKGPGDKVYTYTVYALSAQPQFSVPAQQVNRAVMLDAVKNITLASAELHVVYARP